LFAAITAAARAIADGQDIAAALAQARATILRGGFRQVDYIEARNADTLAPLGSRAEPGRLLVAAVLGKARLIDNVAIPKA
jgi:pantoate--beta-alanine ligase